MIRTLFGLFVLIAAVALALGARPPTPLVVAIFTAYGMGLVAEGLGMRKTR